jgi:hypothetical protein
MAGSRHEVAVTVEQARLARFLQSINKHRKALDLE